MRTGRPRRVTRRAVRRVWEDGTGQVQHATAQAGWAGGLFALRVTRRGRLDTGGLDDRMIRCLMKINGTLMEIDRKSTEINRKSMKFNEHRWEPT